MNQKFILMLGALIGIAGYTAPSLAQDVGVSINVGQPGFYGQIDLGNAPRPRVIYTEPRIVEHVTVVEQPMYLHVPPGHAKHWNKHCQEYNACARPVYFVNDDWYNSVYVPSYREQHGERGNHGDHGDDQQDEEHGGGDEGHGHGHGKGKHKGHDD